MHHVIYERRKCKEWVVADLDRNKFKNNQTLKLPLASVKIIENSQKNSHLFCRMTKVTKVNRYLHRQ